MDAYFPFPANHAGTDLVSITKEGQVLTGQDKLYASAVKDLSSQQLILKVVNTAEQAQQLEISLKGVKSMGEGVETTLRSDNLEAVNSFESPGKISPIESNLALKGRTLKKEIPAQAFVVYQITLKK